MSQITTPAAPVLELDTCLGYLVPEHEAPAGELSAAVLCPACEERLDREVRPHRYASTAIPRVAAPVACPNGHTDRAAHYFDCLYCYGD